MLWYEVIYSICVGAFFGGLVLVLILLFLSGSSLFSSSGSGELDSSNPDFEGDVSFDVETSDFDGDITSDFDTSIEINDSSLPDSAPDTIELNGVSDNDLGVNMATDMQGSIEDIIYTSNVPLSLNLSLTLLWFGSIGLISFNIFQHKWLWIIVTCILTWILQLLLSKLWKKIAQNNTYRIFEGKSLLGEKAVIKVDTSQDGGIITVKTPSGLQQLNAKTFFPLSYYYSGENVYIVDYENRIYFVDQDRENIVHQHDKSKIKVPLFSK